MPEKRLYLSLELVSPFEKSGGPMESLKVERVAPRVIKAGKPLDIYLPSMYRQARGLRKVSYQTRGVER
jgi:hypothetical protein